MLLSWLTILLLLVISILLTKSIFGIYKKSAESTARAGIAKADLAKLVERKEALVSDLKRIKSTSGIEAELRGKFDVGKDGEHLLVIIDKEVETSNETPEESWWSSMWRKLTE